jgi:excisionase family DNA binding protein
MPPPCTSAREPLTVSELAKRMRVSKQTVWRAIASGEIAATKLGRQYRIPAHEADRLTGEGS